MRYPSYLRCSRHLVLALLLCLATTGCSLVTVPVKTAGSIVTTTVKTTGEVITAPFGAMGRDRSGDDEKEETGPDRQAHP